MRSGEVPSVDIPHGTLVLSRVVDGVGVALDAAFERSLTGYAVVTPQAALLLDDAECVLTFESGVPVLAYHLASDAGGTDALTAFPAGGPCRVELFTLPAEALATAHETPDLRVPPGAPAEHLAGDEALADRCRERAPDREDDAGTDPLAAFLADEERIAAIQEEAQAEAARRAEEWGLDDHLSE
ncbi:hypothetical protein ACFPYI_06685 [Halomarina salina]|uniref:DUF8054 domain-containing protein n=1 Tax=Halomarina salina TaxID=1872699 RepID=A0ABD5RKA5_9EURY|nr:hypothetical protein [Halomarina salina]